MLIAVYPGRFQPFHKGHLAAIEHILSENDRLYIIICSKKNYTELDDKNPFTFEERKEMMELSIPTEFLERVTICHVSDSGSDKEWTNVIDAYIPEPDFTTYSNNPITVAAFKNHGYMTRSLPVMEEGLNATFIRKLLIRRDDYVGFIPNGTRKVIEGITKK